MLLAFAGERMLSHVVADAGDERATQIAAELMAELYAPSDRLLPTALLPDSEPRSATRRKANAILSEGTDPLPTAV